MLGGSMGRCQGRSINIKANLLEVLAWIQDKLGQIFCLGEFVSQTANAFLQPAAQLITNALGKLSMNHALIPKSAQSV